MDKSLNWITEAMAARYLEISSQRVSQLVANQTLYSETHLKQRLIWFEDVKKYQRIIKKRKEDREEKREAKKRLQHRMNEIQG